MALPSHIVAELLLKLGYFTALVLNLVGLGLGSPLVRQLAISLCPVLLAILLISRKTRLGWVSPAYSHCVLVGLTLIMFADLLMAEPAAYYLRYPGIMVLTLSLLLFTAAFSLPSDPLLNNLLGSLGAVDANDSFSASKSADSSFSSRIRPRVRMSSLLPKKIPVHFSRFFLFLFTGTFMIVLISVFGFAGGSRSTDPRFTTTVCIIVVESFLLWRAIARIGYMAPLVSVEGLIETSLLHRSREEASRASAGLGSAGQNILSEFYGFRGSRSGVSRADLSAFYVEDEDVLLGVGSSSLSSPPSSRQSLRPRSSHTTSTTNNDPYRKELDADMDSTREPTPRDIMLLQRRTRNIALSHTESAAAESRLSQWLGLLGAICLSVALLLLVYDRLWVSAAAAALDGAGSEGADPGYTGEPDLLCTVFYTILSWTGQTLIVASVPSGVRPTGTLDDAAVSSPPAAPESPLAPNSGGAGSNCTSTPLRVALLLPAHGYSAVEVAVTWFSLVRRGHIVSFVTPYGRSELLHRRYFPPPFLPSVRGLSLVAFLPLRLLLLPLQVLMLPLRLARSLCALYRHAPQAHAPGLYMSALYGHDSGEDAPLILRILREVFLPRGVSLDLLSPGPLIVAMFRELLESVAFRKPLAWRKLPLEVAELELERKVIRARQRRLSRADGASEPNYEPYGSGGSSASSGSSDLSDSGEFRTGRRQRGALHSAPYGNGGGSNSGSDFEDGVGQFSFSRIFNPRLWYSNASTRRNSQLKSFSKFSREKPTFVNTPEFRELLHTYRTQMLADPIHLDAAVVVGKYPYFYPQRKVRRGLFNGQGIDVPDTAASPAVDIPLHEDVELLRLLDALVAEGKPVAAIGSGVLCLAALAQREFGNDKSNSKKGRSSGIVDVARAVSSATLAVESKSIELVKAVTYALFGAAPLLYPLRLILYTCCGRFRKKHQGVSGVSGIDGDEEQESWGGRGEFMEDTARGYLAGVTSSSVIKQQSSPNLRTGSLYQDQGTAVEQRYLDSTGPASVGARGKLVCSENVLSFESLCTFFATGDSIALRTPDPFSDEGANVQVSGPFITAQGAADIFPFTRAFIKRLEETSSMH